MNSQQVFRPAFGNRPDEIVGRDEVIGTFMRGLTLPSGSRERTTLFVGQRGMGKTALFLELEERSRGAGYVVARVTAGPTMLDEIIELVQIKGAEFVGGTKGKVQGFSAGALGFSFGLTFSEEVRENYGFRVKLGMLCDCLEKVGKGVLILVDEVQAASDELRTLATTYQNLIGEGRDIAVGMAGLPTSVSNLLNDRLLTFLNRAWKVELGPIPLASIRSYFARTFSSMGKTWEDGVLDGAVEHTRGFPYLMQLVGYYLVSFCGDSTTVDARMLAQALAAARSDLVDTVFAPALSPLSDKDREFLRAMAEDDGVSKIADIRQRLGVTDGQLQPYRARLIDSQVIASPRRGEVEFLVPYLGEYLRDANR